MLTSGYVNVWYEMKRLQQTNTAITQNRQNGPTYLSVNINLYAQHLQVLAKNQVYLEKCSP